MPSTPSHLKIGFQRNSYSRVSFGKRVNEEESKKERNPDIEPLNGKFTFVPFIKLIPFFGQINYRTMRHISLL